MSDFQIVEPLQLQELFEHLAVAPLRELRSSDDPFEDTRMRQCNLDKRNNSPFSPRELEVLRCKFSPRIDFRFPHRRGFGYRKELNAPNFLFGLEVVLLELDWQLKDFAWQISNAVHFSFTDRRGSQLAVFRSHNIQIE